MRKVAFTELLHSVYTLFTQAFIESLLVKVNGKIERTHVVIT